MKRRDLDRSVLFDVLYVDGSRTSRRKIPKTVVDEGEAATKAAIEAQDREIEIASGRSRGVVKSLVRSRV